MKPQLPPNIEALLPNAIIAHIYTFVPHLKKEKIPATIMDRSPNAQRDLRNIQCRHICSVNAMYMRDLEDFLLDV